MARICGGVEAGIIDVCEIEELPDNICCKDCIRLDCGNRCTIDIGEPCDHEEEGK